MNFQPQNSHTRPLFRKISVLKFKEKINLYHLLANLLIIVYLLSSVIGLFFS